VLRVTVYTSARPNQAPDVFWAEMAPCEHLVQLYSDETEFLDSLEAFAAGGLQLGEAVIVIATAPHVAALNQRLRARGMSLPKLQMSHQYITQDADELLGSFMRDDWPDDERFELAVESLLGRAAGNGRRVRAFGEMVALLWARGHNGATVRLEHLWQELCHSRKFSLLCAYPKSGFTGDAASSIRDICATHTAALIS
jgi:hypothetical protein